jgi:Bacterial PH domain
LSYVEKNLVPGETLLYQTRHHWIVLLGPAFLSFAMEIAGIALLLLAFGGKSNPGDANAGVGGSKIAILIAAFFLLLGGSATLLYGLAKRNATEMAVTNKRVLIKTGMASRRTLDLMLGKVESIGVEETMMGRTLGFGTVILRGTGGTPESFVMIAHPQEFRRQVQEHVGLQSSS